MLHGKFIFLVLIVLTELAIAEPVGRFDGTWGVRLVSTAGICGSSASHALTVQGGRVGSASSGISVTGQVAPNGAVRLAMQRGPASGTASGRLSLAAGSGTWIVSSMGCAGHWIAQRHTTVKPSPSGPDPARDGAFGGR